MEKGAYYIANYSLQQRRESERVRERWEEPDIWLM